MWYDGKEMFFKKRIDLLVLIFLPVFAVIISLLFQTNLLISTFLFFGIPAVYLSCRAKWAIKKAAFFSFIVTLPLGFIFDYLAVLDKTWHVPTIFPFRLLNVVPIEDLIWAFLLSYFSILFYEHFLDKSRDEKMSKNIKFLVFAWSLLLVIFFILLSLKPEVFHIPYFYFWGGIVFLLIPAVTFLFFFPKLINKFVKVAVYSFVLAIMFELTALQLGHWTFPGDHFIGWVELFGYRFPFEEFFFWFIMAAVAGLSYYEFFADDRK